MLTPKIYDEQELLALQTAPNRLIECVAPVAFSHVGYPTSVHDVASLHRYAEVMHELRMQQITDLLHGGLSQDEASAYRSIAGTVATMTDRLYGRKRLARASLLDGMHIKRHIDYLYPDRRPAVLEIGPGSGYLGALLSLAGHRYVATDISQAFYLYHSHLLHEISPTDFDERALRSTEHGPEALRVTHLPWWHFYRMDGAPQIEAEVVTANHCLCEMHPNAATYVLRLVACLLRKTPTGALVIFSLGSQILRTASDLLATAHGCGLRLAFHDEKITVLVAEGHVDYPRALADVPGQMSHPTTIPAYSSGGVISRSIEQGRVATAVTVPMSSIDDIGRSVLGREDIRTDDQIFLDMLSEPVCMAIKS